MRVIPQHGRQDAVDKRQCHVPAALPAGPGRAGSRTPCPVWYTHNLKDVLSSGQVHLVRSGRVPSTRARSTRVLYCCTASPSEGEEIIGIEIA